MHWSNMGGMVVKVCLKDCTSRGIFVMSSVTVRFMGVMRVHVLIGRWSNMRQIKDNSSKDWKHTGQQIANHVNHTTTT